MTSSCSNRSYNVEDIAAGQQAILVFADTLKLSALLECSLALVLISLCALRYTGLSLHEQPLLVTSPWQQSTNARMPFQ